MFYVFRFKRILGGMFFFLIMTSERSNWLAVAAPPPTASSLLPLACPFFFLFFDDVSYNYYDLLLLAYLIGSTRRRWYESKLNECQGTNSLPFQNSLIILQPTHYSTKEKLPEQVEQFNCPPKHCSSKKIPPKGFQRRGQDFSNYYG